MKRVSLVVTMVLASMTAAPGFAGDQVVTLSVPDMTCSACPANVKRALGRLDGVKNIAVNLDKREAAVTYDDNKTNVEALLDVTAFAGYMATVKR